MRQSLLFNKTRRNISKDIVATSHKYLVKADFIEKTISGVYRFLPLGFKVLKNIEKIIREEMVGLGGQEVFLPTLQSKKLWEETDRWKNFDPPLFKFKDVHEKEIALGPTHEEEMTDMVRRRIFSYQDLPFSLFQIQNKFRNEVRATGGLLRTIEFIMKDLYSFHSNKKDFIDFYERVKSAYFNIFKRCGLDITVVDADSGTIGGDYSNEFMVVTDVGEDTILTCGHCGYGVNIEKIKGSKKCPKCEGVLESKKAIELGHTFCLGTKYSEMMKANYRNEKGEEKPIIMGCYGIGVSRLMAAIVELNNDDNGIIWPKEVAPFQLHLICLSSDGKIKKQANQLYVQLEEDGFSVLYDDRGDKSVGEKFIESDLIGIPIRIIVSEKTLKKESVGIKRREDKEEQLIKINNLNKFLKKC